MQKKLFIKIQVITILMLILFIYTIPNVSFGATYTQEVKQGIENFPKSYQAKLNELKKLHPNWSFTAYYTGISWNDLITNENVHGRNVVPSSSQSSWKCAACSGSNYWHCASREAIEYFIDPRNFLDEKRIFQFEELSYNAGVHTLESIQKSVKGTFLENSVTYYDENTKQNVTKSYSQIILEAAQITNISPFHIKSKIIQEVGSQGSDSVSGTCRGYESLYNFFNYGAYDTGNPVENGLIYAREHGWTNPYIAIVEGAKLIGNSYINMGQNTSYFFKFDVVVDRIIKAGETATVQSSDLFWHQYMTNLMDPYSQSPSVFNMYAANGNLDANLNFIIPVYSGMPNEIVNDPTPVPTPKPTPVPTPTPTPKPPEKQYKINETDKTIKLVPEANLAAILKVEKVSNYNITDVKGNVLAKNDEKLATGYTLNILDTDNKTVKKQYVMIRAGDVNGDGKVQAKDALETLRCSMGIKELNGAYLKACDTNNDSKVQAKDALEILRYCMGIDQIDV